MRKFTGWRDEPRPSGTWALACGLLLGVLGCGCDFRLDRSEKAQQSLPAPPPSASPSAPTVVVPMPDPVAPPTGAPKTFAELAAQVNPGVVFVRRIEVVRGFRGNQLREGGSGSGFVFDARGHILTNFHVVNGARGVVVDLIDGRSLAATLVGADPATDVAVLKIDATDITVLSLGDSAAAQVGDWVMAVGNPFGLSHTVSAGIISAKDRSGAEVALGDPDAYYEFMQTDASINPGNSGGPLLDLHGRVIGINTAIRADANSIGFAIPINMVRELLPRLEADGVIERALIGVSTDDVPREKGPGVLAGPRGKGALVREVASGFPADRAGVVPGDIIVAIGGREVEGPERLRWLASLTPIGKPVPITVLRGGEKLELAVTPIAKRAVQR